MGLLDRIKKAFPLSLKSTVVRLQDELEEATYVSSCRGIHIDVLKEQFNGLKETNRQMFNAVINDRNEIAHLRNALEDIYKDNCPSYLVTPSCGHWYDAFSDRSVVTVRIPEFAFRHAFNTESRAYAGFVDYISKEFGRKCGEHVSKAVSDFLNPPTKPQE